MALLTLTQADGWTQISAGEAQIQLKGTSETIAIIHSATVPLVTVPVEFIVSNGVFNNISNNDISYSLGKSPCYIKVLSNGTATVAVQDIS